jgi:hypothetical protein
VVSPELPSNALTPTRITFAVVRMAVAIVGAVALLGDYGYDVLGFSSFATSNYFRYFTNQSNMAGVIVLGLGAWMGLRRASDPRWLVTARMLTTTYVIVSGIVFILIVTQAGDYNIRIVVPWSSQILHFWIPAYSIFEWFAAPGRTRLPWKSLLIVPIYPLVWGGYTMIRGAVIGWYPYFFLDPGQVSGPVEFSLYSGAALALIHGIAAALVWLTRVQPISERWRLRPATSSSARTARDSRARAPAPPRR